MCCPLLSHLTAHCNIVWNSKEDVVIYNVSFARSTHVVQMLEHGRGYALLM